MNYRTLGKTGLRVSELGMGCSGIGRSLHRRDDAGALATLHASLEAGVNFFDTAPGYSAGDSEYLLGRAFRSCRDRVIITSKAGSGATLAGRLAKRYKHLLRPVRHLLRPLQPVLPVLYQSQKRVDFSRDFIVRSLEGSLRRMGTDYLDILLLHHPTRQVLVQADFCETFLELRQAGKIRHWGVSADTLDQAMLCLEIPGIEVIQLELSVVNRAPLDGFLSRARERNIGIVARKVLEQGLLSATAYPTKADRWQPDRQRLRELKHKIEKLEFLVTGERTLRQVALLFIRSLPAVATAAVGYSSLEHLRENLGACFLPELSAAELSRIESIMRPVAPPHG
jgi:aryl-alcohol dehydrogenase-like predicted oxidoreductase